MLQKLRILAVGVAISAVICPSACEAYVHRLRFPLAGYREYQLGKGQVMYSQSYETTGAGSGTLTVEVSNVPLPAGTLLEVVVHNKQVGTLTLDKERNGRLVLVSSSKWAVPRVNEGSDVMLRLPAGGRVLW